MTTAQVSVDGIAKSFGAVRAVRGVSFDIQPGEILGLCGHNGAGKSTVVKMISGQLSPDEGRILVRGEEITMSSRRDAQRLGVALVDQELSVIAELTVLENLMLGDITAPLLNRLSVQRRAAQDMLRDVGLEDIDPMAPLSSLSIGERQLVEIARALSQNARLVILDEPTATLSDIETAKVFESVRRVAAGGCSVVFVSHRLGEVIRLCDRVTVLRDGEVVTTTAASELTVDHLIRQMLGESLHKVESQAGAVEAGHGTLVIEGLHVAGSVEDLALTAHGGNIYALAGQLGSGASESLRAIAGLVPEAVGRLTLDGSEITLADPVGSARAGFAFVSNDRKSEGLFLSRSIAENLVATRLPRLGRSGFLAKGADLKEAKRVAATAGLSENRLGHNVMTLSGGNQQKVFVGRCLERDDVTVILLDEPTRGVDIGGRAAIHQLLRDAADSGLIVIFASTELEEVLELGDIILTMNDGHVIGRYDGGVDADTLMRDMTHEVKAG